MTAPNTTEKEPESAITGYHAHIYYDVETKPAAEALSAAISDRFEARIGNWHDEPVGPHTKAMVQVAFEPALFGRLVPFLMLNRAGLTVLVHPATGRSLADHTTHALWLGQVLAVKEEAFKS